MNHSRAAVVVCPEGYVKDDEAGELDAEQLLSVIRESTDAANEERVKHGFSTMRVEGWPEPPHYDKQLHHLVWGIKGSGKGVAGAESRNARSRLHSGALESPVGSMQASWQIS